MPPKLLLKLAGLLVTVGVLAGCGFKPMPVPDSSGIPPGPGLLTGKTGEWVIFGKNPDPS